MTRTPFWVDDGDATANDPANRDRRGVWDKLILDGRTMPGVAKVDVEQARKVDDKGSPGRNGARLVDKGAEAAKVTIELRVWTPAQLDELTTALPSLNYREERFTRARTQQELEAEGAARIAAYDELAAGAATSGAVGGLSALALQRLNPASQINVTRATTRDTRRVRHPLAISHPMTKLAGISCVYVTKIHATHPSDGVLVVRLDCLEYLAAANRRSSTRAPTQRANGDFTRRTAFDAPAASQPAATTPATPPSRGNAGP